VDGCWDFIYVNKLIYINENLKAHPFLHESVEQDKERAKPELVPIIIATKIGIL
jgi:hypothetical protein